MAIPAPTLRAEPDGTLVLHMPKFSSHDWGKLIFLVIGWVWIGGLFIAMPFTPEGPASRAGAVVLIGLGLTVLTLGLRAAVRWHRRIELGEWRIDESGIEFRASKGTDRRLGWGDVDRVLWGDEGFWLVGVTGQVHLIRDLLPEADWRTLRARIESELSPRFDLTVAPPPDTKMVLWRVLPASAASCLFILASFWAVIRDPIRWGRPVMVLWLLALAMPLMLGTILASRDHHRRIWRYPRPALGKGNGPTAEAIA